MNLGWLATEVPHCPVVPTLSYELDPFDLLPQSLFGPDDGQPSARRALNPRRVEQVDSDVCGNVILVGDLEVDGALMRCPAPTRQWHVDHIERVDPHGGVPNEKV